MSCPFCGTGLSTVAAICPSCKNQLPEAHLIPYYSAALARDKTLAQADRRAELDAIVKTEAAARSTLLNEARERARIEEERERVERLRKADELRTHYVAEAAEARLRREAFVTRNRKKLIAWGTAAIMSVTALVVTINMLRPEAIGIAASEPEVRVQPCIALGNAAKDSITLLNNTLDGFRDGGLSLVEIRELGESAKNIQTELLTSTIGQANDMPEVEGSVLSFANVLGIFENSLVGLDSEFMIISKATSPVHEIAKEAEQICKSSGFYKQFNEASGWK
jgi:hypothetical protein